LTNAHEADTITAIRKAVKGRVSLYASFREPRFGVMGYERIWLNMVPEPWRR